MRKLQEEILTEDYESCLRGGKIARTCHLENWLSALGRLRAKQTE